VRIIFSYTLIFLLVSHTLSQLVIVSNFLLNQDYIAKNLCVNKEKPVLKCNGKCHLAKELKENEEKKTEKVEIKIDLSLYVPSEKELYACEKIEFTTKSSSNFVCSQKILTGFLSTTFHPPS
jgi:hypothetical protein